MAKAKGSLIPMRGSVEDWGPGKQQRNLEAKEAYARKMKEQAAQGPPDFAKLLSLGAKPPEGPQRARKRAKTTKKKAPKRPHRSKAKKKAARGRR